MTFKMALSGTILLILCLGTYLLWGLFTAVKRKTVRSFLLQDGSYLLVTVALLHVAFGFPSMSHTYTSKGTQPGLEYFVLVAVAAGLGSIAQPLSQYFAQPIAARKRRAFDIGPFVKSLLTTPFTLVPLFTVLLNSSIDFSPWTPAWGVGLLLAYQSGFIGKCLPSFGAHSTDGNS